MIYYKICTIIDKGHPVLALSENNKYITFRSLSEAGEKLKMDSKNIYRAIKRNGKSNNYKWYKLNSEEAQNILKIHKPLKIKF